MDIPEPDPPGRPHHAEQRLHPHEKAAGGSRTSGYALSRSPAHLRHSRADQRRGCQNALRHSGPHENLVHAGHLHPCHRGYAPQSVGDCGRVHE